MSPAAFKIGQNERRRPPADEVHNPGGSIELVPIYGQTPNCCPWLNYLHLSSLDGVRGAYALEIVLGVDNLVFIAILTGRLPPEHRAMARQLGSGDGGVRADRIAAWRHRG